jgi:hypothetical protein
MSGSLIGSVIGAALAYFTGGMSAAMGWMVGGVVGGLLSPPSGPNGPRLDDLKPQSSEYGRPIPIVYGTVGIGGNVIWASDLVEESHEEGGGLFGGGSEVFEYFGNMAVAVCEGPRTLGRIWAGPEKRLIWDGAILEGADAGAVLRWYSGAEGQLPDALIESYEGVGNVPGYRGTAYLVLEHFPLLKDGNRLPFLTIETGAESEATIAPTNLGVVWVTQVIITDDYYCAFYWGSYYGVVIRNLDTGTLVAHYTYPIGEWDIGAKWFFDADREVFVRTEDAMGYSTIALSNGAMVHHVISEAALTDGNPGTQCVDGVYHNGAYIFAARGSPGVPERVTLFVMDPDSHEPAATYASNTASGIFAGPLLAPLAGEPCVYGFSSPQTLSRFALSLGQSPEDLGLPAASPLAVRMDPNTGYIWSANVSGGGTVVVHCNDPATDTLIYGPDSILTGMSSFSAETFAFVPGTPNRLIIGGSQWLATDVFLEFNADAPAVMYEYVGGYHGTAEILALTYNPTTNQLMAFREGGRISFGDPSNPASVNYLVGGTYTQEPDNKYLGEADGTAAPHHGQLLSEIVADLSERAGLTSGQYDVTQLADDMVDGYAIERSTTVREAIATLMPAYFFDAVESGGVAKFVKRGGAIAAVIDDDELGAHESGTEPPDPLESTRRMENELPETLSTRYLLEATNYSTGSRYARRLVGASGDEQTLDLPLVLTDTKAQEIAEVNLHAAWVGRITYRFSLPRKYAYLEPTDIIVVQGHTMRLEKMTYKGGRFQCEARHDDSNVYVPNVIVTETPPAGGDVAVNTEIVLELM